MKKLLLLAWGWCVICSAAGASTLIGLSAGDLTDQSGAALPANSLLLLIASGTDSQFENSLTEGQFVGGDDIALAFASVNNNLGGIQTTSNSFNLSTTLVGQPIAIRWFSNFTYQQYLNAETPLVGSRYGTFAGQTTGTPNDGMPWVLPGVGGAITINFVTESANLFGDLQLADAYNNSFGQTLSTVAVVPEPGGIGLVLTGCVFGLIFLRRHAWAERVMNSLLRQYPTRTIS